VRGHLLLILAGALAIPAGAQAVEVLGYAGVLGEWELTATVTEDVSQPAKEFSGPLTMRHVGIASRMVRKKRQVKYAFGPVRLYPVNRDDRDRRRNLHLSRRLF
jgi:hypothetical protein